MIEPFSFLSGILNVAELSLLFSRDQSSQLKKHRCCNVLLQEFCPIISSMVLSLLISLH